MRHLEEKSQIGDLLVSTTGSYDPGIFKQTDLKEISGEAAVDIGLVENETEENES